MQIFLSYALPDGAFAKALSSQLEKRGFSVWNPEEEVLPGDNVWLRTGEALKKSRAMVVLVSPDAMRSSNVKREIEYALGDPRYKDRLFPVQVRRTSNIPWILRKMKSFGTGRDPAKVSESIANALKQVA